MPRNLDRRVEIAFPVLDPALRERLRVLLETQLADTVKGRRVRGDGRSTRRDEEVPSLRSQVRLWELTASI
jgi:polyphosphate kinase